jgi:hypothetical protein
MLNRWLRQLRRNLVGSLDRVALAPATTRIRRKSGSRYRPRIEELETRLAPAVTVGWVSGSDTLYIEAANSASAPAAINVAWSSTSGGTWTVKTIGDTMSIPPNNSSGLSLDPTNTVLTTTDQINNVTIGGPNGGAIGFADTADTVNLGDVPISGNLIVNAGTINFQGGEAVPYQGTVSIATDPADGPSHYTITMPGTGPGWGALNFANNDSITTGVVGFKGTATIIGISPDGYTLTVSSTAFFFQHVSGLNLPNITVTVNGAQVHAANVTLNSANSLQMQPTAVPYLGNVAIHAAPPAGQPYSGYPYLTGPNWGAYGYQPGDTVTISAPAPEFDVTTTSSSDIQTIADATTALQNDPNPLSSTEPVLDFSYNESSNLDAFTNSQYYNNPLSMPADSSGVYTSYVFHATAEVYIPSAGTWTFGTHSDDGVQLMVGNTTVLDHNTTTSPTDTFGTFTATSPGLYPLDLLYFNHNGGGCLQLFAAQNNWSNFSDTTFELVGDTAAGGLSVTTVGNPTGYTVANTVGDNLYLVNLTSEPVPPGNYPGVTVALASGTFTPQITASNHLSLNATKQGRTITGAVSTNNLAATTNNGNITLDLPGSVTLNTLDAGNANIVLHAQGSIMSGTPVAPATVNLEAGSVDLTTTGAGNSIGPTAGLKTDIAELTAATNDGNVWVSNYDRQLPLTINSVVADQNGQAASANDDQIVYNSTPDQLIPTYVVGSSQVTITSPGPIILNSISATGSVQVDGLYVVEGDGQTPSIIAPTVTLEALGAANYEGQVTFANSSNGDTLTLPDPGPSWTDLGFANGTAMAGAPIVVSGASDSGNDGTFIVQSIAGKILTLQQGNVLDPETELLVSVGDGMIGLENSSSSNTTTLPSTAQGPVELSEVGNFTAITSNGNVFLALGGSVDSTAVQVDAGGTGNVAVTSQASFLTIENITAIGSRPLGASSRLGGNVAVGMNSGALLEYLQGNGSPGIIAGQIVAVTSPLSIGSPSSPLLTNAYSGLSVTANATSPSSAAVYVDNPSNLTSVGVSTDDGTVAVNYDQDASTGTYAGLLSFSNNQLSADDSAVVSFANTDRNDGSNDDVVVNGTIDASSITAGGRILAGSNSPIITGQAVALNAGTGIGIGTMITTQVTALAASTNTGNIRMFADAPSTTGAGATVKLTTDSGAITSVTLAKGGSGYPANSTVLLEVTGGGGTGGVVEAATNANGVITSIVSLVAANGSSTDVLAAGNGYTNTTGAATSVEFNLLSASTSNGNINIRNIGNDDLILDGISTGSQNTAQFLSDGNIYYTTQVSSAAASGNSATANSTSANSTSANSATLSGLSAGTLVLSALTGVIGTASNPLNTSVTTMTAEGGTLFLSNNTSLTLTTPPNSGITGDVTISTIGNLALDSASLGTVGSSNVSLTITAGTLTTTNGSSIDAGALTISAEQIGTPTTDVIQTNATTINATADYGGVYINNLGSSPLTLTAGAVGPTSTNGAPTNNIYVSSQGIIVLWPQMSTLPGAGTTPVALYSPGGTAKLHVAVGEYITSIYDIVSGLGDTSLLKNGMAVSGAGIPAGDTIQRVLNSLNEIVLSEPATASGNNSLTFTPVVTGTGTVTGTTVSGIHSSGPLTSGMAMSGLGIPAGDTIAQVNSASVITLAMAATPSGGPIALTFYSTQSTTETGTTTGIPETAGTPATYFDVYTGTLIIGSSTITNSVSLLSGAGFGPLVTETNTAEVTVFAPIAITNSGPLELTPDMIASGGTFTGSSITIDDLGTVPQAIAASLVLEATGSIVFLNTTNSISLNAGCTITVEAGGVAALSNITTANGDVTIVAGGNVGIGTVNAGTGTVQIASSGSIFDSNGGTVSIQAGQTNLAQAQIQVIGQGPSPAPSTAANLPQLQLQAAQAFATAAAASAQAAADQTTANAFQAELNSIEATVTSDNLTYQNAVTATNAAQATVNKDSNTLNALTWTVDALGEADAVTWLVSAGFLLFGESSSIAAWTTAADPVTEPLAAIIGAEASTSETVGGTLNLVAAGLGVAAASMEFAVTGEAITLGNDQTTLTNAQLAQAQAYARLLADQDELTAVAAADGAAAQAAVSEAIIAQQDQAVAQADSALVMAASAASAQASVQAVAASVANATAQPLTVNGGSLTITGEAPTASGMTNLTVSTPVTVGSGGATLNGNGSPMTVSANITAPGSIALVDSGTASGGDNLSVSPGATVASAASSVALAAGDNIDISAGATIQASSTISITADANAATYQGQVTFGSNTLALPATIPGPNNTTIPGPTWTTLGFGSGNSIAVSGAVGAVAADNGQFTVASHGVSTDGYTLTLTTSGLTAGTGTVTVASATGARDAGNVTPANLTVAGMLNAPSALINVPVNATRLATISITPSATTPITVIGAGTETTIASGSNGLSLPQSTIAVSSTTGFPSSGTVAIAIGSSTVYLSYTGKTSTSFTGCSGGSGTLATGDFVTNGDTLNVNFNTVGLAITISYTQTPTGTQSLSSGTITAPGMQTIIFTNMAAVNITDAAGGAAMTLNGNTSVANTMSLVGSAQRAGIVTLDNAPLSFSGAASFSYQGGGKGDTISVTPFATPEVPWDLAVTVAGGTGSPASLTYNSVASNEADTATVTGPNSGVIGSPGLAAIQFSNVGTLTANAGQLTGDQLTVSLASKFVLNAYDTLTAEETAPGTVAMTLNASSASTATFSMNSSAYGTVNLSDTTDTALFEVGVASTTASVNFGVMSSPVYSDHLLVKDEGTKSTGSSDSTTPGGITGSGLVTVGTFNPVTYQNISSAKILPSLTVTDAGGTFTAGKTYPATAKVLGLASLASVKPTVTYYRYTGATFAPTVDYYHGTFTAPSTTGTNTITKLSGAPSSVGTYAAVATFAGAVNTAVTYAPNWVWKTFSITQAASHASVHALATRTPTVTAGGPYTISEGGSLTLRATATDPNGTTLTYSWNLNGTDTFGQVVGAHPTLTWSQLAALGITPNGTAPGTYQVRVMVRDAVGQVITSAPVTLTVNYVPPIPTISGPSVAVVGGTYTLDFSARDTFSNPITSWTIRWGDGTGSTVPILTGKPTKVAHTYTTTGHFFITASADNGLGSYEAINSVHVDVANG